MTFIYKLDSFKKFFVVELVGWLVVSYYLVPALIRLCERTVDR